MNRSLALAAVSALALSAPALAGPLIHLAGGRPSRDSYVACWGVRVADFGRRFASDGQLEVEAVASTVPCNIAYAGDDPSCTVQIASVGDAFKGVVRFVRVDYTLKTVADIFDVDAVKLGEETVLEKEIDVPRGGAVTVEVSPRLPATFGSSALLLERADNGTRLLATAFARITDPQTPPGAQEYRICMDLSDADAIRRLKTAPNRIGVPVTFECDGATPHRREEVVRRIRAIGETGYPVCLEFGAGEGNSPTQPLGRIRPHLTDDGVLRETKSDFAWLPQYDQEYKQYVKSLVKEFGWPRGPVNGVMLWNEPWEGISISGWGADVLRYRELYTLMAEAVEEARAEDPELRVMIGGCDSSSNTFDKLFPDGTDAFLQRLDFLSLHYQGLQPSAAKFMRERKNPVYGRVRYWDTESWCANTPERVPGTLAAMLAAGHDRMVGIQGEAVVATPYEVNVRGADGKSARRRVFRAWPTAPALAAFQRYVGNRNFEKILFEGLPWVYLFRGKDEGDLTAIVCGDISAAFDGPGRNGLVPFWTARQPGKTVSGEMRLAGAAGFSLFDGNGNPVAKGGDSLTVPLSDASYYIRPDGTPEGARRLVAALEAAAVTGLPKVAPSFRDAVAPLARCTEKAVSFKAVLRNISNKPVSGKLEVACEGLALAYARNIEIPVRAERVVPVAVASGAPSEANAYPFTLRFTDAEGGVAEWKEVLHCNVIADAAKGDGAAYVHPVLPAGGGMTTMEKAWLPMVQGRADESAADEGTAAVRLSADDEFFRFSARIKDSTVDAGTRRFAQPGDDDCFYPDEVREINMDNTIDVKPGTTSVPVPGSRRVWTTDVRYLEFALDVPAGGGTVALLLADDDDSVRREYDIRVAGEGGAKDYRRIRPLIDRCWLRFPAPAGNVKVRIGLQPWMSWMKPKIAAIAVDAPEEGLDNVAFDKDVGSGFARKYGAVAKFEPAESGVEVPGLAWTHHREERVLRWPEGVRHYSYRRNPVLPCGSSPEFDNVQIGFNALPREAKPWCDAAPGAFHGYSSYWDNDYVFDLNPVAEAYGGGFEIWRERAPYLPDKHFYPRQPRHPRDGAVEGGSLTVRRENGFRIVEAAIPWSEIPEVKALRDAGVPVRFSCRINDGGRPGACIELARGRSASKRNVSFKPDWKEHWASEIAFGWEK